MEKKDTAWSLALPICLGIVSIIVMYQVGVALKVFGDQQYSLADRYQEDATFPRGLLSYLDDGSLRPATDEEVRAWVDQYRFDMIGKVPSLQLTEIYGRTHFDLMINGVFFVSKKITLPTGMFGNKKRQFIIPEGVPAPDYQDLGDSQLYFMKPMKCVGRHGKCRFERYLRED